MWTLHDIGIKTVASGLAALTIGGGAVLLNVNKDNAVQDQRLLVLERAVSKIDDMDRTIHILDTKVDVLNQKLDDAKEALRKPK